MTTTSDVETTGAAVVDSDSETTGLVVTTGTYVEVVEIIWLVELVEREGGEHPLLEFVRVRPIS